MISFIADHKIGQSKQNMKWFDLGNSPVMRVLQGVQRKPSTPSAHLMALFCFGLQICSSCVNFIEVFKWLFSNNSCPSKFISLLFQLAGGSSGVSFSRKGIPSTSRKEVGIQDQLVWKEMFLFFSRSVSMAVSLGCILYETEKRLILPCWIICAPIDSSKQMRFVACA